MTTLVAKANETRTDGKCFDANTLRMFAREQPDKYVYFEAQQELWTKKPKKDKKNVDLR